jgi:penicillin-binding protein 2
LEIPSQRRASGRDFWNRLAWFGAVAAVAFLLLIARLYNLQISQGQGFYDKSVDNFVKEVKIPADRGQLIDRRGEVLADSRPSFDLTLTPYFCGRGCDEVIGRLSAYLQLSDEEHSKVLQRLRDTRGLARFKPFPVKVDIGRDLVDVFEAHKSELDGVDLLPTPHRNYRRATLGAHVLGYLSEVNPQELEKLQAEGKDYHEGDYLGRRGVERGFEEFLRGKEGAERIAVDAKGRQLPKHQGLIPESERVRPQHPGANVILSLDVRLQEVADHAFPGRAGAVIALDPNTGFILAMVSRPEFDPNLLTGRISRAELAAMQADPLQPDLFRPTQQQYHPGSTFKPVTALAGLEHGTIAPHTSVFCNGGYSLGGRRWRCWNDLGHGTQDLHAALVHSCDTFFYSAADKMGLDVLAETGRELGLGKPTGLGLGYEVPGVMPDVAYHDRVTPGGYQRGLALNTAIGQGDVNVTPLQMAMLYAALANGGVVYRPQIVKRIEDVEGRSLRVFEPEIRGRLSVQPKNLKAVVDGLVGVVNEPGGTAYGHRLKDIQVAGKTGTAQVIAMGAVRVKSADLSYEQGDHAWFCAFAPAEKPEIAVVVVNEHAGHGGAVAAPTAMAVIQAYFDEKAQDEATHAEPDPPRRPPPPVEKPSDEDEPGPGAPQPREAVPRKVLGAVLGPALELRWT